METDVGGTLSNKRMQRRPRSESRINRSMPLAAPLIRAVIRTDTREARLLYSILSRYALGPFS